MSMTADARPPLPTDAADRARVHETALRRRLLYSQHSGDVWERLVRSVGYERARAWRPLDMSANPYATTWRSLSALYREEPDIAGPHPDVIEAVAEAGQWSLMQRVQRDTLGLGEELKLCELDADGSPTAHVIHPDLATVDCDPRRPRVLRAVHFWEPDPRAPARWIRWTIQHRNSQGEIDPAYTAMEPDGTDVTAELRHGATDYPWIGQDGPVMPVVMYHREITGACWDPYSFFEVVDGSLSLCILYTSYSHAVRQASWKQKYTLGASVRTGDVEPGRPQQVIADPATILQLDADEGVAQPMIGTLDQPVDLEDMIGSIRVYERRLVEQASGGIEVTRESSDIRSGYSLAVGREAQLQQQRRFAPQFRSADRQALSVWSDLLAVDRGQRYPSRWPTRRGPTRQDPADIVYQLGAPIEAPGESSSGTDP